MIIRLAVHHIGAPSSPVPRCEHCNIKSYNFFFIINYNCDNKRRITPSQATHDGCPGDERLRTSADRCGDGKTPTTVSNSISLDWGRGCVGAASGLLGAEVAAKAQAVLQCGGKNALHRRHRQR